MSVDSDRPVVVSLHRPDLVSGVSSAGEALARSAPPHIAWRPMIIGPVSASHEHSPLALAPGCVRVSWADGASPVAQVLAVRDALREADAGVVVSNDLPHGLVAAGLDEHRGRRAVAWIHGDDHDWDELLLRAWPLVHAWRPVSERIGRRTRALGVTLPEPAPALSAGVRLPAQPAPWDAEDLARGPLRLLFCGRLEKRWKRVLDLARLADELHARGVEFVLSIAGDGPAARELAERAWDHVRGGRVRLLGALPRILMPKLLRHNHMLVLVSASEGAPMAVMEAMAQGRAPAVSTSCGAAVDWLRDAQDGLVFATGDMPALAQRLAEVSAERAWIQRMGAAAHATARRCFGVESIAPRADALVRQAAAADPRVGTSDPASLARGWSAMLETMELIGPLDAAEIDRLARTWCQDMRIVDPGLARVSPQRPSREARLLLAALVGLRARGAWRVALYGCGQHTRRLAPWLARAPEVVAIIDDRAGEPGGPPSVLAGVPVVLPRGAHALTLDAVVISSDEHEREMFPKAQTWAGEVPVVPLYETARALTVARAA